MYKKERIVDLKALTRCVLEKWKGILLVALIAAVLFGGLKGFSLYKVYKQGQAQAEVETVPEEDSQGASKAIEMRRINKQLDLKNAYFTESIMGDIDPTKEGFASADVIVTIGDEAVEAAQPAQTEKQTGQVPGKALRKRKRLRKRRRAAGICQDTEQGNDDPQLLRQFRYVPRGPDQCGEAAGDDSQQALRADFL